MSSAIPFDERNDVAFLHVSTPNFSTVPVEVVDRGGYLWVRKEDLRCFSNLTTGFDKRGVSDWYQKERAANKVQVSVPQSLLFDVHLASCGGAVSKAERMELAKCWMRVTCEGGRLFGKLKQLKQSIAACVRLCQQVECRRLGWTGRGLRCDSKRNMNVGLKNKKPDTVLT